MKAGASKRDVTVPELLGNPNVHDPLFARVLILDDGDNAVEEAYANRVPVSLLRVLQLSSKNDLT